MRHVRDEFFRFLGSGAVNTAASYAVYFALLRFMPYLVAYAIAYAFGVLLSYLLLTRFVFRAKAQWATALRFPLVYVAQFVLGSGTTYALVEGMRMDPALAAAIAIVLVVPATFVVARYVFRHARKGAPAERSGRSAS